ncbi:MAG: OmpH family outer membrane protein [Blastocatellia bacterium]|nr:OmpH family outer membrane protein [Blastocatellia bacterium]
MRAIGLMIALLSLGGWASVWAQGQTPTQSPPQSQGATPAPVPVGRIAVINTNAFFADDGIQQLLQQARRVNDMFKDKEAELKALEQRVESLRRELETQGPNLTPQARADKQETLEQLEREYQRKKEDAERAYQRALRDAIGPVRERIGAFLETYAKSRGITIVLEVANLVQAGGLVYVDPAADITRDFINEYNKANPVTTSSAPSSAAPASSSVERPASGARSSPASQRTPPRRP